MLQIYIIEWELGTKSLSFQPEIDFQPFHLEHKPEIEFWTETLLRQIRKNEK